MQRKPVYCIVTLFTLLFLTQISFGQIGIGKGIKVGSNFSTLTDAEDGSETLKNICGGVSLHLNMLGAISFEIDFLYSPKGVGLEGVKDIKLKYLSIPITLKKRLLPVGLRPYILGGVEFSYLLDASGPMDDFKEILNSQDIAAVVGAGVELSFIGKGIYAEGRYTFGFDEIFKEDFDLVGESKNRVAQIYIGIFF